MKYKTIIDTDDFKNFKFFEDGNGKYICGIDAGAEDKEWMPLYFTEYKQEPSRDIKEIEEIINCDADAETKCKMISNILTAKLHCFEEQDAQENKGKQTMLIKFTKDFANNWKTGDVAKAKYLEKGEVLIDDVAKIDMGLLLNHCKIISEDEDKE